MRFRRWSRKSCAVFSSIGRHVTIGNLKSIIADTLLGKQQNICALTVEEKKSDNRAESSPPEDPPDELFLSEINLIHTLNYGNDYCSNVAHTFTVTQTYIYSRK